MVRFRLQRLRQWRTWLTWPVALALWPLVVRNYRLRLNGVLPDEFYWADMWLLRLGWTVG